MKKIAPYQIFFPLGILNAFLAVGVWFVQGLNWFEAPTLLIHSKLIAGGFLWSFIVGFLMTAIPRMTGTADANKLEYGVSVTLVAALMMASWDASPRPFYLIHGFLVIFIVIFGLRRLLRASKPIPIFFSHVGMAMILALVGDFFYFRGQSYLGLHLFHVGTVLLLILGIGTRFFSFLSGLPSVFENAPEAWRRWLFHCSGVLVGILLYLSGKGIGVAYLGLALLTLIYLFVIWKVQRPSERPSALKHGVRVAAFLIPLSFFLCWWYPTLFVTWFHLLFIGCFSLLTFSVATRVTLAHGAYPTEWEISSKTLWYVVGFLILGLVARTCYGFTVDLWWRKSWLHFAATFWFLAVGVWCYSYILKIFKPGPQAKPSC